MPLTIDQCARGSIVDRLVEWGEDGKERPLNPIRRGIIVNVDGEPSQETVKGIYVCFGPDEGESSVTVNKVTVKCTLTKAAELNVVFDREHSYSKKAWRRLFRFQDQVGFEFENRKAQQPKRRKIKDELGLTTRATGDAPVQDDPVHLNTKESEDTYVDNAEETVVKSKK